MTDYIVIVIGLGIIFYVLYKTRGNDNNRDGTAYC